jgi:hypothetical protein
MQRTVRSLSLRVLFLSGVLLAGGARLHDVAAAPLDLRQAVRNSQLIFRGTIKRLGAAAMAGVPVSASTAVVSVDEVISAPAPVGGLTGREITVALRQPMREGRQAVFFATGWIYGTGLAVREVDRLEGGQTTAELRKAVADAARRNEEADLAERLARAELVVVGRVVRTVDVSREGRRPRSEHDPGLFRALLQAETVLKGAASPGGELSFLFANSRDVAWRRAPKPQEGQTGVWILFRDERPGLRVDGLTAFDPRDVQPLERAGTVRRLLASPPRP